MTGEDRRDEVGDVVQVDPTMPMSKKIRDCRNHRLDHFVWMGGEEDSGGMDFLADRLWV